MSRKVMRIFELLISQFPTQEAGADKTAWLALVMAGWGRRQVPECRLHITWLPSIFHRACYSHFFVVAQSFTVAVAPRERELRSLHQPSSSFSIDAHSHRPLDAEPSFTRPKLPQTYSLVVDHTSDPCITHAARELLDCTNRSAPT
jgi:hypothetical protein